MNTLQEWAQKSFDVQDACNLSGVVFDFGRLVDFLKAEANRLGKTDRWIDEHPLVSLWVEKMEHLAHSQLLDPIVTEDSVATITKRLVEKQQQVNESDRQYGTDITNRHPLIQDEILRLVHVTRGRDDFGRTVAPENDVFVGDRKKGRDNWYEPASEPFVIAFLITPSGNWIIRGGSDGVRKYIEKNFRQYIVQYTWWQDGLSRSHWSGSEGIFVKELRGTSPDRLGERYGRSLMCRGERKYFHISLSTIDGFKPSALILRRMPKVWLPEYNQASKSRRDIISYVLYAFYRTEIAPGEGMTWEDWEKEGFSKAHILLAKPKIEIKDLEHITSVEQGLQFCLNRWAYEVENSPKTITKVL